MNKGLVSEIQKFCVHDGPGIRTVVFLKGCNLSCLWCQNPETINGEPELQYSERLCIHCGTCIEACPEGAISPEPETPTLDPAKCRRNFSCTEACPTKALSVVGKWMSSGEIMREIESDRIFYENSGGGVTFSGGEPTLQYDFLLTLLAEAGARNIHRAVETNGNLAADKFAKLLDRVETVMFDIKHMDSATHKKLTGAGNQLIQANLETLSHQGKVAWIPRFPLIPSLNDSPDNLYATAKRLRELGASQLHVLPYHRLGHVKSDSMVSSAEKQQLWEVPSDEDVEAAAAILTGDGLMATIGG